MLPPSTSSAATFLTVVLNLLLAQPASLKPLQSPAPCNGPRFSKATCYSAQEVEYGKLDDCTDAIEGLQKLWAISQLFPWGGERLLLITSPVTRCAIAVEALPERPPWEPIISPKDFKMVDYLSDIRKINRQCIKSGNGYGGFTHIGPDRKVVITIYHGGDPDPYESDSAANKGWNALEFEDCTISADSVSVILPSQSGAAKDAGTSVGPS